MRTDFFTLVGVKSFDSTHRRVRKPGRPVRDVEDMPFRVSMRTGANTRWSSYGRITRSKPLFRWLLTQVGRPWSDVYAAAVRQFDYRTEHGSVVLEWVRNRVDTETFIANDGSVRVWQNDCRVDRHVDQGRAGYSSEVGDLYVHPDTGLLQYEDRRIGCVQKAKTRKALDEQALAQERVFVSKTRQLHKLNGQWFWVVLAPIEPPKMLRQRPFTQADGTVVERRPLMDINSICHDVLLCQDFTEKPDRTWTYSSLLKLYGKNTHYAKSKHQASNADIRRHVKH